MARLRKACRPWRKAEEGDTAAGVMVAGGGRYFVVEPDELFPARLPLEIEIGAGRGDFIVARASTLPQRNFLAVERAGAVAHSLSLRAERTGLSNLRVVRMDARPLVNLFLGDNSVSVYHIYFPDPWPKARHAKHRLFTPYFVANLARTLSTGGSLHIATDVQAYATAIFSMLERQGFRRIGIAAPGLAETAFARKFMAERRLVYSGTFQK